MQSRDHTSVSKNVTQGKRLVLVFVALITIGLLGCASSTILPERSGILGKFFPREGARFYLPRPYIVVLKEFPVATQIEVLPGFMSPDGLLVRFDDIKQLNLNEDVQIRNARSGGGGGWVLLQRVGDRLEQQLERLDGKLSETSGGADPITSAITSAIVGEIGSTITSSLPPSAPANDTVTDAVSSVIASTPVTPIETIRPKDAPHGGSAKTFVKKGDLSEFRDPVNDLFEIRYLPDLETKYVLKSDAGLGSAEIDAYLARGWIVQHYGASVDRTELGRSVFANLQAIVDLARTAGRAYLSSALPTTIAAAGGVQTASQGGLEETSADGSITSVYTDRKIMVKVVVVEYAVPGVYPILKPSEYPSVESGTGLSVVKIPRSNQQPVNVAMPVGYRTRKDIFVSAIPVVVSEGHGSISIEGNAPNPIRRMSCDSPRIRQLLHDHLFICTNESLATGASLANAVWANTTLTLSISDIPSSADVSQPNDAFRSSIYKCITQIGSENDCQTLAELRNNETLIIGPAQ